MSKSATLTLQQWGNSLAVRIPAAVARSARFKVGQPVESVRAGLQCVGQVLGRGTRLTLAQKLAAYDPDLHEAKSWLPLRWGQRHSDGCPQGLVSGPSRHDLDRLQSQAGREMKDVHPLVVLSPREFNERTGIVIGLPMTTAAYNDTNPFAVKFKAPRA